MNPITSGLREKLQKLINVFVKEKSDEHIYNSKDRTLNLAKIVDEEGIHSIFRSFEFSPFQYEKLFDLEMGRIGRYKDYESIIMRIPEANKALTIISDAVMAPNLGKKTNTLNLDPVRGMIGKKGLEIIKLILDKTKMELKILPSFIFGTCLYGDTFIEIKKTQNAPRFIVHDPKRCVLLFDKATDIELGLVVQLDNDNKSVLLDLIAKNLPTLNIELPEGRRNSIVVSSINKQPMSERALKDLESIVQDAVNELGAKIKYIQPSHYVHMSITSNNIYSPYGTSVLDAVRSIAKQLLLNEAALSIARVTRAPSRKQFSVECGNMPESEVPSFMEGVKNQIKREKIIDTSKGLSIDSIPDILSIDEDYWTRSVGGTPLLTVENIPGDDLSTNIDDMEYWKKKLLSSLGIPPAYLANEEGTSTRALLTLEDINFSRQIKKLQIDINIGLNQLIDNCLIIMGYPELVGSVTISLPEPQNIEDNVRLENMSNRISVANDLKGLIPYISVKWLAKNIIGLTEEELKEMEKEKDEEKKMAIFYNPDELENNPIGYGEGGGFSNVETFGGSSPIEEETGEEFPEMGGEEEGMGTSETIEPETEEPAETEKI